MLYSNFKASPRRYRVSFGELYAIPLGIYSPQNGRCLIPTKKSIIIHRGENADLTVGFGRTGNARIERSRLGETADNQAFLLLSAQSGPLQFGNGRIFVLKKCSRNVAVLAYGFEKDQRGHFWEAALLRIDQDALIRVEPSGKENGLDDEIFLFHHGCLHRITEEEIRQFSHQLRQNRIFSYEGAGFKDDEWLSLESIPNLYRQKRQKV